MLRVPPETETSAAVKSELALLKVKVMTAACPAVKEVLSLLTTMVGGVVSAPVVSALKLTVLLGLLGLAAASLNLDVSTLMAGLPLALAVGVNTAV